MKKESSGAGTTYENQEFQS